MSAHRRKAASPLNPDNRRAKWIAARIRDPEELADVLSKYFRHPAQRAVALASIRRYLKFDVEDVPQCSTQ